MRTFIRIAWDVILYGARGRQLDLSETYRWLHTQRVGRAALWSVCVGMNFVTTGNLALLAMWLRRDEHRVT